MLSGIIVAYVFDNVIVALPHIDIGGEFKNQARFEREFAVFQA